METDPNKQIPRLNSDELLHETCEIDLDFHGIKIALISEYEFFMDGFKELEDDITGMHIQESKDFSDTDGTIIYVPSDEIDTKYIEQEKALVISGPSHLFGNGTALAFAAHYMAECLRSSKNGLVLVHSAAVQLPDQDQAYVFLGEKGAGKTTLALRLCHQYHYRLIGNDQVYLGPGNQENIVAYGGNAWFNVRQTAISADPYIAEIVPPMPTNIEIPSWNRKVRIQPSDIGVNTTSQELPVKSLFHIRIDHTQQDLLVGEWSGVQRNLVLHERFGRHITGQATPFQDDSGNYLGSLPPINIKASLRARDELVGMILQNGITEIFAPNSDAVVEYITTIKD